jgi:hypothetical protein
VLLGDGDDTVEIGISQFMNVAGESGNDAFVGATAPGGSDVIYSGGTGADAVAYGKADRPVRVGPTGSSGRIGLDSDTIGSDVERVFGSAFGDQLTAVHPREATLVGQGGDDVLTGSGGSGAFTTFDMGRQPDGADRVVPGPGFSNVDYSQRTRPVNVTLGFRGADDGEVGERDDIGTGGQDIFVAGGSAGDTLSSAFSVISNYSFHGNGGIDTLEGGGSSEYMVGGAERDTYLAGGGNDTIYATDGIGEVIGCGSGAGDFATVDSLDGLSSCENSSVGTLQLTPKTARVRAGDVVRMQLSWRHPRAWKQLRTIKLRLTHDGSPVGEVAIRPAAERIEDAGAVRLVRKATRLVRDGRTVTAHLAFRVDNAQAGGALQAEVEATDRRGARQIERAAATVRASG